MIIGYGLANLVVAKGMFSPVPDVHGASGVYFMARPIVSCTFGLLSFHTQRL
jgi:hypothetical protein